jgi:hypothetical protein
VAYVISVLKATTRYRCEVKPKWADDRQQNAVAFVISVLKATARYRCEVKPKSSDDNRMLWPM